MSVLVQSTYLLTALQSFVNNGGPSGASVFRIDKVDARNGDTAQRSIDVNLVASGATADASTLRLTQAIAPAQTLDLLEIVGHDLEVGDSIQALASVDNVVSIRVSGRYV